MITLKQMAAPVVTALAVGALTQCGIAARAQTAARSCRSAGIIPLTTPESEPRLMIEAPAAEPMASRGVAVIAYCAEGMRIAPVFGTGALAVSPRLGHIHVTVDDAPWRWADASGNPLILQGLPPGPHKVLIDLVDANHQVVDSGSIRFDVPQRPTIPRPQ